MIRISTVIITYNYGEFLEECIESVLRQDYKSLEVIVIDDGSTDETEEIMKQFEQVKYIKQEHKGISKARNLGISMAKGDYIAFLDADDIWCDDKLKLQSEFLKKHPDTEIVFGTYSNFLQKEELIEDDNIKTMFDLQVEHSIVTSIIKKSVFNNVGDFNEELVYGEDVEWLIRCKLSKVEMKHMDIVVTKRRIHGKNISIVPQMKESDYSRVLAATFREKINESKK